jgi:hypothetical protein
MWWVKMMPKESDINWEMLGKIPAAYWLEVCDGMETLEALLAVSDGEDAAQAVQSYPILIFPLFPRAIEALAQSNC